MARRAREMSDSGFMHVIVRGTDGQPLFKSEEDYACYLDSLERYARELRVKVCAYCLMEDHAHLLLYDAGKRIPALMKKLGVRYSRYFNKKYNRTGHVFRDRYRSETAEDDAYLAKVFRHILRNPEKAGICGASEYPWSSYALYGDRKSFADTKPLEEIIGDKAAYEAWIAEENEDECLEYMPPKHDDEWARNVIRRQLKGISGTALRDMEREERNEALRKLKKAGLSVRQIERLTGINRGIVQKA